MVDHLSWRQPLAFRVGLVQPFVAQAPQPFHLGGSEALRKGREVLDGALRQFLAALDTLVVVAELAAQIDGRVVALARLVEHPQRLLEDGLDVLRLTVVVLVVLVVLLGGLAGSRIGLVRFRPPR